MNLRKKKALLAPFLVLVFISGAWGAMEKAEMINGVQWGQWSDRDKLVYVRAISNWVDFDAAAQIQTQARTGKHWFSMSMAVAKVLKNKTLGQVVTEVNNYYQKNPGKIDVSVVEVILGQIAQFPPAGKEKQQ